MTATQLLKSLAAGPLRADEASVRFVRLLGAGVGHSVAYRIDLHLHLHSVAREVVFICPAGSHGRRDATLRFVARREWASAAHRGRCQRKDNLSHVEQNHLHQPDP